MIDLYLFVFCKCICLLFTVFDLYIFQFPHIFFFERKPGHFTPSYDMSRLHISCVRFLSCVSLDWFLTQCKQFIALVVGFLLVNKTPDCGVCVDLVLEPTLLLSVVSFSAPCLSSWICIFLLPFLNYLLWKCTNQRCCNLWVFADWKAHQLFCLFQICLSWNWIRFHHSPPKMRRSTSGSLSQSSTRTGRKQTPLSFILLDIVKNCLCNIKVNSWIL